MKSLYIIPFIFFSFITQAQIVNIPDANFKNALVNTICADTTGDGIINSNVDLNNDGEIQESEALAVFGLQVLSQDISSIEGIESFTNLTDLLFDGNQLTNVDISQNILLETIKINNNQLTSLDVSQNTLLEKLYVGINQLTSLDVSQNTLLETINIGINQLTSLDVSQNPLLKRLHGSNNQLTSLDVSQNTLLESLVIHNNFLTNLDLTNNPNLVGLQVPANLLTNLDLSQNPNLKSLLCSYNLLTVLDLSHNHKLYTLLCDNNELLESLNIKNGNNHRINDFFAYDNPNLTCIQVDDINYANNQNCSMQQHPNWCKDSWAYYSEDCNLGTQDMSHQSYTIQPNPAQNILNINSKEPVDLVRIYSTNGSLIKESSSSSIDVSELSKGLYFIQITVNENSVIKKFIKE